jgi:hypothetical protein
MRFEVEKEYPEVNEKSGTSISASRFSHNEEWPTAILNFTYNIRAKLNEILAVNGIGIIMYMRVRRCLTNYPYRIFIE